MKKKMSKSYKKIPEHRDLTTLDAILRHGGPMRHRADRRPKEKVDYKKEYEEENDD